MVDSNVMRIFVSHSHEDNSYCQELVSALRQARVDVWYDEHNMTAGQLLDAIEAELRLRPVFIVILTPASLRSSWVHDECKWAYTLLKRDPTRIILPVLAAAVDENEIWLFLEGFKRIEAAGSRPYPTSEAIQRVLNVLALSQAEVVEVSPMSPAASSSSHDELMLRGKALEAQRKFVGALAAFEEASRVAPDSLVAQQHIGYVQVELAQDEDALATIARVLERDPDDAFSWRNRANALNGLRRNNEALDAADAAIRIDPMDAFAWVYRGVALIQLHRYQDALIAFDRAISLEPRLYTAWLMKALMLRALNEDEEALTAVGRAQALDPTSAYGWPGQTTEMRARYLGRVAGLPA